MASLPPMVQLVGNYRVLFEGYWAMLDPQGTGKIDAGSAAAFLKKSQLREPVLHKIWNMSDPSSKGYLDRQGLYMALRLIAVCQAGKEPTVTNMALSDPPPKLAGVEAPPTLLVNKWSIEESERAKHDTVFQGLQPMKGLLPGDKAKPFMLSSKLPMDTLGKIWNLSDIDKDGSLDLDEFCVAMKLISLAQGGEVLPAVLPASLMPASKTNEVKGSGPAAPTATVLSPSPKGSSVLSPTVVSASLGVKSDSSPSHGSPLADRKRSATPVGAGVTGSGVEWVVTPELKTRYDGYFQGIDKDHDGYVSGEEARSLFMASNLQQHVLAHIWNLCDMEKNGKLNAEQFALAMFLIAEKVRKKDIPKDLTAAMIPPSLRGKIAVPTPTSGASSDAAKTSAVTTPSGWGQAAAATSVTWTTPQGSDASTPGGVEEAGFGNDFSAIQELDSITNEIETIKKEKVELAEDIKAKQELIQQKRVEMEGFQEDVDQASKQRETLEREREEARSLLEQLDSEKAKFEGQIAELKQNCDDEREEIERLKVQLSAQQMSNKSQAEELEKLRLQLEQLRKEEKEYKQKVELSKAEMDKVQKANQNLNTDITQVRQRIENLKEEHQSLTTALTLYPQGNTLSGNSASSGVVNINDVGKLSAELHVPHVAEHDAISARATAGSSSPVSSLSGFSTNSHLDDGAEESVAKDDRTHSEGFGSTRDPFAAFSIPPSEENFSGRNFSGKPSVLSAFDPFGGGSDPFKSSTSASSAPATGEDMFRSSDLFSGATSSAHISSSSSASSLPPTTGSMPLPAVDPFSGQDPFKADPFSSASKNTTQPASLWGGSSPFDVDPFGQQNIQTPTDPFASGDPFGEDPFATKALGAGSSNPFHVGGGSGGTGFAGAWNQDLGSDQKNHKS